MNEISMIGLDTAKRVFQLCGIDREGSVVLVRRLKRRELLGFVAKLARCRIALEACGASYHWAREFEKLGHTALLVPPGFVKRFAEGRAKSDARDAKALAFAGRSADLRPVPVRSEADQAALMLVKVRSLMTRQRTQAANALRGHLAEFGITAAAGNRGFAELMARLEKDGFGLPEPAVAALSLLAAHWRDIDAAIAKLGASLLERAKADPVVKRLSRMPGVGPITATVFALKVDASRFKTGRALAAWLGLTPKQHSSGEKRRLGGITKAGDEDLRSLLVLGAAARLIAAKRHIHTADPWVRDLLKRRPFKVAAVAVAAHMARGLWAMLKTGADYRTPRHADAAP